MKKDTSYSFQSKKGMEVTFEELHIRHINLLIDIKNKKLNNWFLKMAIINTFDEFRTLNDEESCTLCGVTNPSLKKPRIKSCLSSFSFKLVFSFASVMYKFSSSKFMNLFIMGFKKS